MIEQISDALDVDDRSFVWVGLYQPDDKLPLKMQEEFDRHLLAVEGEYPAPWGGDACQYSQGIRRLVRRQYAR